MEEAHGRLSRKWILKMEFSPLISYLTSFYQVVKSAFNPTNTKGNCDMKPILRCLIFLMVALWSVSVAQAETRTNPVAETSSGGDVQGAITPDTKSNTSAPTTSAEGRRRSVTLEGKTVLPLRVLARPFSHIYREKDVSKGTIKENLPVFQPYYVYTRPDARDIELQDGWYEVGEDNRGNVLGWMRAADVFEWKQTMCLSYTHPEGRHPVLMFGNKGALEQIVKSPAKERTLKAKALYAAIDARQIPSDFPVRSVEPKQAVDISKQFYFLPILNFQQIELEGREGRLLQLAAATATNPEARQSTDLQENPGYLAQATQETAVAGNQVLQQLKVDVVFVMDTTVSMRPYIKSTLEVIKGVAKGITEDPILAESIYFGAWGYRDPVDQIEGIGYTTYNYTPELQSVDKFIETLSQVEVTKVDSVDYPEDVFSGIADALAKTTWTPGAMRVMVLLGDAPGHKLGHKYNVSGQNPSSLRTLANDTKVYLFALHVKEPRAKRFHTEAEEQFRALSRNKGMGQDSAYFAVSSRDMTAFAQAAADLTGSLNVMLAQAKQGKVMAGPVAPQQPPAAALSSGELGALQPEAPVAGKAETQADDSQKARDLAYQMLKAALVEWIGQQTGAKAPRDIVAWAVDKDLLEPAIPSMEVRLLINKRQLDSLKTVLSEVMAAGRRGQIGGEDFFAALQATAASAARDPNMIKNAQTIAKTGLIPEFLTDLPYKSRLMSLSNDLWMRWSIDEQDEFLAELEARIKAYQAIHDRPEGWVAMNRGDDPDDYVYPISLDLLP